MTKQHFTALADAFRRNKPVETDFSTDLAFATAMTQWENDLYAVAGVASSFSRQFDRVRFVRAAGLMAVAAGSET